MKVWPFDIIYPSTTNSEIEADVQAAVISGANTLNFYIEAECPDTGFSRSDRPRMTARAAELEFETATVWTVILR